MGEEIKSAISFPEGRGEVEELPLLKIVVILVEEGEDLPLRGVETDVEGRLGVAEFDLAAAAVAGVLLTLEWVLAGALL